MWIILFRTKDGRLDAWIENHIDNANHKLKLIRTDCPSACLFTIETFKTCGLAELVRKYKI